MDFIKVLDQTVREIKREVNLKVLKVPEIEQKVLDATSDEPWGPHGSALAELAQATKKFTECQMIMNVLWTRLSDTGAKWRHVYKALTVIEYLIGNGSERAVDDILEHSFRISSLSGFEYVEPNGKDFGINVRKKVETLVALLTDKDKLQAVRNKADATRDKYFGLSSTGITYKSSPSSYGSSDRYGGFGKSREDDSFKSSYKDEHKDNLKSKDGRSDENENGKSKKGVSRHARRNRDSSSSTPSKTVTKSGSVLSSKSLSEKMRKRFGIPISGRTLILSLVFVLSLSILGSSSSSSQDVRILSAERRIDLTSSIIRAYLTLKVENTGASDTSEILLAFPPTEAEHLAILKASAVEGKKKKKTYVPLEVNPTELPDTPNGAKLFSISLSKPLKSGEKALVEVLYVVTHSLEPFPAEIGQAESQYVYYRDSAVLLSPYHVAEQITYIKTPNNKVESYTRVEPSNRVGTELKYGHYHDQSPYSFSPIIVHFENNNPFAVVEELVRVVEISHWGNVQITEHYKLKHGGARHKGVFSRLEYQGRPSISGAASFKHLLARLPPRVHSVYYRDEIGNVSTSHLRTDKQKSELEIEPRYPLFGGWKATFIIGYGLPLQDFLFESPNGQRYLNFSFGCPLLETVVDELIIKVVLPEGSKSPSASVPFPVEQQLETTYSYLDVIGRTTVVIKKRNVVPEHNVPFQVYYDFSPISMLTEPLMLVSVFFLFFVAFIAYLHIDLSISKSEN